MKRNVDVGIYTEAYIKDHWYAMLLPLRQGELSLEQLSLKLFPNLYRGYLQNYLTRVLGAVFSAWYGSEDIVRLRRQLTINTRKLQCKQRYGVDNISQSSDVRSKVQVTVQQRYGVDNVFQSDTIKSRIKQTSLERYGTENPFQNLEVQERQCQTVQLKYGVDNVFKSDAVKAKSRQAMLERYGVEYAGQSSELMSLRDATNLERYGAISPFQNVLVKEKIKVTCEERYGVSWPSISKRSREAQRATRLKHWAQRLGVTIEDLKDWRKVLGPDFVNFKETVRASGYRLKGSAWGGTYYAFWYDDPDFVSHLQDSRYKQLLFDVNRGGVSKLETEINTQYGGCSSRSFGVELDCYFPDRNIAFELNGYPFHTSEFKPIGKGNCKEVQYHKNKTEMALVNGVRLYHIWYSDYYMDREAVHSFVRSRLGMFDYTYEARKLRLVFPDIVTVNDFCAQYHEGQAPGKALVFSVGLETIDHVLVGLMSFRNHPEGVENARLCFKRGVSVTGGFARLLHHSLIELKHRGFKRLITYCDRDLTPDWKDSVYARHGFTFEGDSGPQLFYWNHKLQIVESRQRYMKHKLAKLFPDSYSDDKTANEILADNDIYPCYNSGTWKFSLEIT